MHWRTVAKTAEAEKHFHATKGPYHTCITRAAKQHAGRAGGFRDSAKLVYAAAASYVRTSGRVREIKIGRRLPVFEHAPSSPWSPPWSSTPRLCALCGQRHARAQRGGEPPHQDWYVCSKRTKCVSTAAYGPLYASFHPLFALRSALVTLPGLIDPGQHELTRTPPKPFIFTPNGSQLDFVRPSTRTHAPCGPSVRVVSRTK